GLFGKRTFTLERVNQTPNSTLAPEERSLLSGLFAGNRKSVHLKGSYEPSIAQAVTNYINKLQKLYAPFHKKGANRWVVWIRSEEHTSELQSREKLVCRLVLDK